AGVVVLKTLSEALADGDPVYAVIRSTALNQDGRSNGLTAPSPQSQEAVLRTAYGKCGISPGQVQYVETHGTGTFLGDPIEAKSLGKVLASGRSPDRPCAIGSVKTNIGHLEAAAGIAGLIKVALSLKYQAIPPSLHFQNPNPHIPFDELPLQVQRTLSPWSRGGGPALAGVSAFGFGGTNVHAVLEEAPEISVTAVADEGKTSNLAHLLPLSAASPEALRALAQEYKTYLKEENVNHPSLQDICHTAGTRRSHYEYRSSFVGSSQSEIIEQLDLFLQSPDQDEGIAVRNEAKQRPRLAFVFSGQGSQWWGMGQTLLEQEPVFRKSLEECDKLFSHHA
ncbi:MAG: type I polyketide synthase, partial [Hyphomicrobiales bacterium]|nr:type I polyketide synthase [Hyphomicrobiales bacterium]